MSWVAYADASVDIEGRAGLAVLLIDPDGLEFRYSASSFVRNSTEAEREAVQEAARRLSWRGANEAVIYTDCTGALAVSAAFPIVWIPREQNRAADTLSRIARTAWEAIASPAPKLSRMIVHPHAQSQQSSQRLLNAVPPTVSKPDPTAEPSTPLVAQAPVFVYQAEQKVSANIGRFLRQNPNATLEDVFHTMPIPTTRVYGALESKGATWFRLTATGELCYHPQGAMKGTAETVRQEIALWCAQNGKSPAHSLKDTVRLEERQRNAGNLIRKKEQKLLYGAVRAFRSCEEGVVALESIRLALDEENRCKWDDIPENGRRIVLLQHPIFRTWWRVGDVLVDPSRVLPKPMLQELWNKLGIPVQVVRPMRFATQVERHLTQGWKTHESRQVIELKSLAEPASSWWWIPDAEERARFVKPPKKRADDSEAIQTLRGEVLKALRAFAARSGTRQELGLPTMPRKFPAWLKGDFSPLLLTSQEALTFCDGWRARMEKATELGLWDTVVIGGRKYMSVASVLTTRREPALWDRVLDDMFSVRAEEVRHILGVSSERFNALLRQHGMERQKEAVRSYRGYTVDVLSRGEARKLIGLYAAWKEDGDG